MKPYELDIILGSLYKSDKNEWERTRWLGYVLSLPNIDRKKCPKFGPKDLIEFAWEEDTSSKNKPELPKTISKKDVKRLEKTTNKFLEGLKNIDLDY